ncbi:hypothetical protein K0U83_10360 [bacterium]|nr:hypothetical protein [bacterium]
MDGIEADFSELIELAVDLEKVADNAGPHIRKAVEATAFDVKKDAVKKVRKRKMLGQAAAAIDYELKGFQGFGATVLDAEIGYDKDKPGGPLGNLVEFGAPRASEVRLVRDKQGKARWMPVKGTSRPLPPGSELQGALQENEDNFMERLDAAIDDTMEEAGL